MTLAWIRKGRAVVTRPEPPAKRVIWSRRDDLPLVVVVLAVPNVESVAGMPDVVMASAGVINQLF